MKTLASKPATKTRANPNKVLVQPLKIPTSKQIRNIARYTISKIIGSDMGFASSI